MKSNRTENNRILLSVIDKNCGTGGTPEHRGRTIGTIQVLSSWLNRGEFRIIAIPTEQKKKRAFSHAKRNYSDDDENCEQKPITILVHYNNNNKSDSNTHTHGHKNIYRRYWSKQHLHLSHSINNSSQFISECVTTTKRSKRKIDNYNNNTGGGVGEREGKKSRQKTKHTK